MLHYKVNDEGQLLKVRETGFAKERELQVLCENNLQELFGLDFIASEFTIGNFRIDTLAFDPENNSFVIIEYKNTRNYSVIDQGYSYLSTMLNNKADFILEYNENQTNTLKRDCIDWTQSKVIFISPRFTDYQKHSINFKNLPIELWEIKQFENKSVFFDKISTNNASESINAITKDTEINQVNKEIKIYSEDDHLIAIPSEISEMYHTLKESILGINDSITIRPTKKYIGFVLDKRNVMDMVIQKNALKMWFNSKAGTLNDPFEITKDVSNTGHWGNGDYELKINDLESIDYIINLVKQVIKINCS